MTDEPKKRIRRSAADVAADYLARAARAQSKDQRKAIAILNKAGEMIVEAEALCGADAPQAVTDAGTAVLGAIAAIEKDLPEGAR